MSHHTVSRTGLFQVLRRAATEGAVTLGSVCWLVRVCAAQTEPLLTKGTRVRVVIPAADSQPERLVTGSLIHLEGDTVVIGTGNGLAMPETQTVALEHGWRLEALATSRGHGGRGAGLGAVFGALAGAMIGSATWQPCRQQGFLACFMYPSQGEQAAGGAVLGAAGGALLGLMIGSSIQSETWVPVHTAGVRLAVAPGVAGISLAF